MNIWQDNWINPTTPQKIISSRKILPDNARVGDLIDQDAMQWKQSLIDSIFLPLEAAQIKSIQLRTLRPDIMVWCSSPNGHLTTRSAYERNPLVSLSKSLNLPQQSHTINTHFE